MSKAKYSNGRRRKASKKKNVKRRKNSGVQRSRQKKPSRSRKRTSSRPRKRTSPRPRRRKSPAPRRRKSPGPRRRKSPGPRRRKSPGPPRRKSPRLKLIRISRDVRIKYFTRYQKGMKSTLVETRGQLFESNYRPHLRKLLKHVHPNMQLTKRSLDQMNGFINYMFHDIASRATHFARGRHLKTMTGREVQNAIKSRFPGNIKIFAVLNGIETLNKYIQNQKRT